MNRSLERKIALGFLTAVAAVVATGITAWMNARRVERVVEWVEHTHQVRFQVESTLVHVLNMQTSVRGFVLTGEEQFVSSYTQGALDADIALAELEKRTRDNPPQHQRVRRLKEILGEIRDAYAAVITVRREQGLQAAQDSALLVNGRAHVDRARAVLAELDGEEQKLLAERSGQSRRAIRNAARIVLVAVLLAAVTLGVTLRFGLRDYRRRVRAERELDDFFRLSLDPLCVVSADGKFLRLNPAWQTALGYPIDEMAGRPFLDFVHPDDVDRTREEAQRVAAGQESISFQNRYRARDGTWRWLEWNGSVVPGSGQVMAVARDITARKDVEAKIAELNEHLQAQNAELEAFSYSVSHDLRAPLRHMSGFAHLLQVHAGASLDDKGRHYIDSITSAATTMGRLIDDLLQFSRTARAPLVLQTVNHDHLVRDIIPMLAGSAADTEWRVAQLPTLPGDTALLRQVWTNFLSNAAKYSAGATPRPVVEVSARTDEAANEVIFAVRDNGVGFDPRYADKLFQVFSRLHDAQQFEGTGIGLALVRRIVSRHGGRTWAESQPGKGATFHFSLPIKPSRRNVS